jgi:hypothetical protein
VREPGPLRDWWCDFAVVNVQAPTKGNDNALRYEPYTYHKLLHSFNAEVRLDDIFRSTKPRVHMDWLYLHF